MDPRDIAAQGIRIANARGAGECAEAAIAALEAEGYSVVKLEQVGGKLLMLDDDPDSYCWVPVFRKVESGYRDAVAESGNRDSDE